MINGVKMSILPKEIHTINTIHIKIAVQFFKEIERTYGTEP